MIWRDLNGLIFIFILLHKEIGRVVWRIVRWHDINVQIFVFFLPHSAWERNRKVDMPSPGLLRVVQRVAWQAVKSGATGVGIGYDSGWENRTDLSLCHVGDICWHLAAKLLVVAKSACVITWSFWQRASSTGIFLQPKLAQWIMWEVCYFLVYSLIFCAIV